MTTMAETAVSRRKVSRRQNLLYVCITNLLMTAVAIADSTQTGKDGVRKTEFLVFEMLGDRTDESSSGNSTGLRFRIAKDGAMSVSAEGEEDSDQSIEMPIPIPIPVPAPSDEDEAEKERFVEQMIVNDFLQGKLQTCKLAMGHSLKQPSESSNWLSGNHGYDLKVEGATPKKRLVIVADGEVSPPLDEFINKSQFVIRFKHGRNFDKGTGNKTTVIVSRWQQIWCPLSLPARMARKMTHSSIPSPMYQNAQGLWMLSCPFSPYGEGRGQKVANYKVGKRTLPITWKSTFLKCHKFIEYYTQDILEKNLPYSVINGTESLLSMFPDYEPSVLKESKSTQLLGRRPSLGFLTLSFVLGNQCFKEYEVHLVGFGFSGWSGHNFEYEKAAVQGLDASKRIVLHPVANQESV